jgi:catechol 2,3-dioxygenase-like lactoylglutathione lyase family enzyme
MSVEAPRDPEELEAAATGPASGDISPLTTLGAVELTVGDLERSLSYYREAIGLDLLGRENGTARLGAGGRELLVLVEEPGARPALGHTGLYHFALLLPERRDLASWLAHVVRDRIPLVGLSDHFVSQAIYLSDPDGHGIEVYWDRPREVWEGQVGARMTTMRLDVDGLLGEVGDAADGFVGLPAGTRPRSWRQAAITITSVRTPGRARERPRRHPARRRSVTRRSCSPTPPSGRASSVASNGPGSRSTTSSATRSYATPRETRWCSPCASGSEAQPPEIVPVPVTLFVTKGFPE